LVLVNTAPAFAVSPDDLARMRAGLGEVAWPHFERVLALQAVDDAELNQAARRVFPLELVRREPERVARMLDGFALRLAPFRRGLGNPRWLERGGQLAQPGADAGGGRCRGLVPPAGSGAAAFAPLPDVEIVIFEQCGHLAFVDRPSFRLLSPLAGALLLCGASGVAGRHAGLPACSTASPQRRSGALAGIFADHTTDGMAIHR
jgi:pimeloyl-ACP methyl ester carboxylesterase